MGNMRFEKTKFGKFWSGKGFYVALAICMVAVGGVAWGAFDGFGILNTEDPASSSSSTVVDYNYNEPAGNTVSGVPIEDNSNPASSSEPASSAPVSSSEAPSSQPAEPTNTTPSYVYPAGTSVLKEFSGEALVYSETMKDWRAHEAVDFELEKGAIVRAMTDGVVKSVYDDDLLGKVVEIDHGNNLVASYCGLGNTVSVRKGDEIKVGQQIGTIGDVPCEIAESAHLHLILTQDGETIDAAKFLSEQP